MRHTGIGPVETDVNVKHLLLAAGKLFARPARFKLRHRPFELGIAGAHLLFVGALAVPQAVGRRGGADGFGHIQRFGQPVHL